MMTLWTGFKQQNFASDESIGPNEKRRSIVLISLDIVFNLQTLLILHILAQFAI